jgi:hypothetical protein
MSSVVISREICDFQRSSKFDPLTVVEN